MSSADNRLIRGVSSSRADNQTGDSKRCRERADDGMVVVVIVVVVAFSSCARILGKCSTIHSPPALFFFFLVDISSRTLIPHMPGSVHSGSAS